MNNTDSIIFPCLEIEQPIGSFYVGVMNHKDLIDISYADIRRIEERDIERVVGIQRPLVESRVKVLQQYVNTIDAAFPTGVILAVDRGVAKHDSLKREMVLPREENIAKIIDGQHRIAGLNGFTGEHFEINVIMFIDMDLEDQAYVFATINLNQTKVSKSLAYDLNEFARNPSPQKTCHDIAKLLNSRTNSPFFNRIKILGRATGKEFENLTQAAFVDRLIIYISDDPMRDRDLIKRGKKLRKIPNPLGSKMFLRNLFIDSDDAKIAKNISNFFMAVQERWEGAWWAKERGVILNRTQGFAGMMRFFEDAYKSYNKADEIVPTEYFAALFAKSSLRDSDFTTDNYPPGTSGESKLYRDLMETCRLNSPLFA